MPRWSTNKKVHTKGFKQIWGKKSYQIKWGNIYKALRITIGLWQALKKCKSYPSFPARSPRVQTPVLTVALETLCILKRWRQDIYHNLNFKYINCDSFYLKRRVFESSNMFENDQRP